MPGFDSLIPFFIATAIFAFMPGPAILYTAAQTVARGRKAGFMAALGIHLGCYIHVIAAALGLSAIFTHVPLAYTAVKLAGAAYLVWLGVKMVRQKLAPADTAHDQEMIGQTKSAQRAFFESMTVEILNPKVAIFFIAFLPQFVDAHGAWPVWAQFMALGAFVNICFSSADVMVIFAADRVAKGMKGIGRKLDLPNKVAGLALIGLGARLALADD
ncbi:MULTISPECIES: LysE family translocator [Kordiimonas]|jgi:threonine/homoserine/homoserine lactone efflux protein|uniref:LysE family translocator n=1 Tax=Kordiimonas TaxID=288021 RepID=UPI002580C1FF|nr:LysE family translocator [Kordiimonas sp. UBA4487]